MPHIIPTTSSPVPKEHVSERASLFSQGLSYVSSALSSSVQLASKLKVPFFLYFIAYADGLKGQKTRLTVEQKQQNMVGAIQSFMQSDGAIGNDLSINTYGYDLVQSINMNHALPLACSVRPDPVLGSPLFSRETFNKYLNDQGVKNEVSQKITLEIGQKNWLNEGALEPENFYDHWASTLGKAAEIRYERYGTPRIQELQKHVFRRLEKTSSVNVNIGSFKASLYREEQGNDALVFLKITLPAEAQMSVATQHYFAFMEAQLNSISAYIGAKAVAQIYIGAVENIVRCIEPNAQATLKKAPVEKTASSFTQTLETASHRGREIL